VFNPLKPGAKRPGVAFGVGSWNARGLLCQSQYDKMKIKVKTLKNIFLLVTSFAYKKLMAMRLLLGNILVKSLSIIGTFAPSARVIRAALLRLSERKRAQSLTESLLRFWSGGGCY